MIVGCRKWHPADAPQVRRSVLFRSVSHKHILQFVELVRVLDLKCVTTSSSLCGAAYFWSIHRLESGRVAAKQLERGWKRPERVLCPGWSSSGLLKAALTQLALITQ